MSRKKPTAMELKNAVNNLINEIGMMSNAFKQLDALFAAYVEFKGDHDEFKKYLDKEIKDAKNKAEQEHKENEEWQQEQDKEAK
tara:strand:+ start:362 stop:613 length:252 start_codon:yes stop_codon:yes gene_type:complete